MADLSGFDANQVEPSTDFEPIPTGKVSRRHYRKRDEINQVGDRALLAVYLPDHRG